MRKHLLSLAAATVVVSGTALGLLASNASGTPEALDIPLTSPRPAAPAPVAMPAEPLPPPLPGPTEAPAIPREDAVAMNDRVPFSTSPNPAAKPFRAEMEGPDAARSLDCLTAAAYYEAASEGDDGERAVVQVVLNRLRHPAFPKSICGVVFQGAERTTGCQFTFTCDGSLQRIPSVAGWRRAGEIAKAALAGKVYAPVGYSTHYHTNWVVPPWSGSLDKVAIVGSHLFFRWTGGWGRPGAFAGHYPGFEPNVPLMTRLSNAHVDGDGEVQLAGTATAPRGPGPGVRAISRGGDVFVAIRSSQVSATSFLGDALRACGSRDFCKFMAWTDQRSAPSAYPLTPSQSRSMSFTYSRNRTTGFEEVRWNCSQFKGRQPDQCMAG